jgi:hypothetical protein
LSPTNDAATPLGPIEILCVTNKFQLSCVTTDDTPVAALTMKINVLKMESSQEEARSGGTALANERVDTCGNNRHNSDKKLLFFQSCLDVTCPTYSSTRVTT